MTQVTSPTRASQPIPVRTMRPVMLAGLLAMVAAATIVLVLVLGDSGASETDSGAARAQSALRSDGGPERSSPVTRVGTRPTSGPLTIRAASPTPAVGPDESNIASSIARASATPVTGPDESAIASSIGGAAPTASAGPDEARVAAAVGGNSDARIPTSFGTR